jgi:hypothetical protein
MAARNIAEAIASLTPEQKESVILFIEFLTRKDSTQSAGSSPFLGAVDEFVEQHPELLRRLAQLPPIQPSMMWSPFTKR